MSSTKVLHLPRTGSILRPLSNVHEKADAGRINVTFDTILVHAAKVALGRGLALVALVFMGFLASQCPSTE